MTTIQLGGLTLSGPQDQLAPALAKAQAEVAVAVKNSRNPHLRNRYADLEAVIAVVRPAMAAHGLACPMAPITDGDQAGVRWLLMHRSGQWMSGECWHKRGSSKGLTPAQADGVCHSYARRYALSALFLVATGDDSDGAVQTSNAKPPARSATPGRAKGTGKRIDRRETHPQAWRQFMDALADAGLSPEALDAWLKKNDRPPAHQIPDEGWSKMCNWALSPAGREAITGGKND